VNTPSVQTVPNTTITQKTIRIAPLVRIDITEEFGWRRMASGPVNVWFAGRLYGDGLARVQRAAWGSDLKALERLLPDLDGHFALVVEADGAVLAAVDPIASFPLFVAQTGEAVPCYAIDTRARRLAHRCGLSKLNDDAVLALAMAGFTLGDSTLYCGLVNLRPGEYALFRDGRCERSRYFVYRPWQVHVRPLDKLQYELADLLRALFEKLANDLGGRTALIPISAGIDSRLVASGLWAVGYRHVRCFSYGQRGNHEAEMGRRVAEHLGFPWKFIETTQKGKVAFFNGPLRREFDAVADTLAAIPFYQDLDELRRLYECGYLPHDAVIINGQSGDYLTGNHVPAALWSDPGPAMDKSARWNRILDASVAKHFSLWRHLLTGGHVERIKRLLRAEIEAWGGAISEANLDFALYEQSEYDNRQTHYVVQGQRAYDYLGFDWRLPLWDSALVKFFESVPLAAKRQQRLYRNTLQRLNWGGVWRLPVNRTWVTPAWLRPVRLAVKFAVAPLGREIWHDLERRWFAWHMNTTCSYAIVAAGTVRRDRRGFRNAFSWHVEDYLVKKGILLDDLVEPFDKHESACC